MKRHQRRHAARRALHRAQGDAAYRWYQKVSQLQPWQDDWLRNQVGDEAVDFVKSAIFAGPWLFPSEQRAGA